MESNNRLTGKCVKVIYITLAIVFLFPVSNIFSQISEGGLPPSFKYQQLLRSLTVETQVPINFNIEDLRETDNWQAREGAPMPVSKLIPVDYSPDNSGYRTTLPGGEKIWRLHLVAKGAVAIMLYYNDFYIPEGGALYIYSADKSQLLGAYTSQTHPSGGLFASEFIGGDELILEYVESETSEEKPRICINEIGYGYNTAALRAFCGITTRASGSCMVDINCEEGDAWQNEKKGVCYTIQKIGTKNYICTASLMNNTAEDFKPLILTARHCASGGGVIADSSEMKQWMFYFHKEREGCGSSYLPVVPKTMTGCRMLVNTEMTGGSDGMLLILNDMIPESYDVFYNGWDRRDIAASSGVNIHHPSGDNMKISTYGEPAKVYTFISSEFNGDKNAHWNVTFMETANGYGVTEEGSSGSPLYNENKLVIGTLTGGNSSCTYSRGLNIYGKMSYHWDKYKTDSSTRMDVWLDPLNNKALTLQGRFRKVFKPSPVNLSAMNMGLSVSLSWSAPNSSEKPVLYNVYRNNYKIGETASFFFVDYEPVNGSVIYSVSAVYANGEVSPFANISTSYLKHNPPYDLKAERISSTSNDVKLSWKAPVYEQTIFWGTMDRTYIVGFDENPPFYFGQRWTSEDISPLNEKTIKAVQFIPRSKNTYEIYISQGARTYRQKIESSSLVFSGLLNTIDLEKPFVVDGTKSLIVSIFISKVGEDYPAVCDNGPVVDGKGNIFSFDAESWEKLYDESTPNKYDYNFIISAIVSSENGSLTDDGDIVRVPSRSSEIILSNGSVKSRVSELPFSEDGISVRSSVPAAFPEITKYKLYRGSQDALTAYYTDVNASDTTYVDRTALKDNFYEITALYGNVESERSNKSGISPYVDIGNVHASVDLYPTKFSAVVYLKGHEYVTRLDVFSVSGNVYLVVNNPGETVDTSSLLPGLYFFRITDSNGQQRVVKAIKTN